MNAAFRSLLMLLVAGAASASLSAADLSGISNTEAVSGLKQALTDGSAAAVAKLGVTDGFLANPKVKIPLPPTLQRVESMLRFAGMNQQADDLVVAMNRAAEAAVPEAKTLLVESVRKMTVQDARGILSGGDTAATDYFKRTTQAELTKRLLPVVKKATDKVGLAVQYNSLTGQAAQFGLMKGEDSTVEGYVTAKALDGLYLMIAEQEKAFRQNPMQATSDIVKRVFGAMR